MKTKEQIEAKLTEIENSVKYSRNLTFGMSSEAEDFHITCIAALSWVLGIESSEAPPIKNFFLDS